MTLNKTDQKIQVSLVDVILMMP